MIESIITVAIPPKTRLIHGTGALLSRDYYEEVEPAHMEAYKLTFNNQEEFYTWLSATNAKPLKA